VNTNRSACSHPNHGVFMFDFVLFDVPSGSEVAKLRVEYIFKSPCTSRSLGEVASSSGGQQAREQKRSAGRQLGGGDDGFD